MILVFLIALPLLGGLLAWWAGRRHADAARLISTAALAIDLLVVLAIWFYFFDGTESGEAGAWLMEYDRPWIPSLGINFHLALDGLSLLLVLLTLFLGLLAVVGSGNEVGKRAGFFHLNLLWTLTGVIGVFLALDLFLFYFFWELMLVPMYFLIAIWGHERRANASFKFFIFTQAGGLFMLLAILGLYFVHGRATGTYTFDYLQLLGTSMSPSVAFWLMLGFFIAFAVKLPVIPFHTWLADAHTEAPTAGSVVLAGLLLKTGAYGLLRFLLPLFPDAAASFSGVGMALGAAGILYGAVLAFAQTDLKRLIAYTSISHMGFVLLGVFAGNRTALLGAVMQMICHGISTGGLFILAGALQQRMHTREMERMGGLWTGMPRMGGFAMVLAMASLGLPGLGNFIGEFLVLLGVFRENVGMAAIAATGLIAATVYALRLVQKVFFGEAKEGLPPAGVPADAPADATVRESLVLAVMIAALVVLGFYPQPVLKTAGPAVAAIETGTYPQKAGAIRLLLRQVNLSTHVRAGEKGAGLP